MADSDFELLIKMLGQTTNDNDNLKLVAMRKANELAQRLGGWEPVLRGKVRINVIADPFANITMPGAHARPPTPPPAYRPPPPPQPAYTRTTPPPPQRPRAPDPVYAPNRPTPPKQPNIDDIWGGAAGNVSNAPPKRIIVNKFEGTCIHCRNRVQAGLGKAFQKVDGGKWYTEHDKDAAGKLQCPPARKKRSAFTSDDLQI